MRLIQLTMAASKYQKFAKDVGLTGITMLFLDFQIILLLPFLTKLLGVSAYGIWSQINATIMVLSTAALFGCGYAILRFLAAEDQSKQISKQFFSAMALTFVTAFIFATSLFLLAEPIASWLLSDVSAAYFIKLASILIVIIALNQVVYRYFEVFRKITSYSALVIVQSVLEIFLVFYLLFQGYGLTGVIVASVIIKSLMFLIGFALVKSQVKFAMPDLEVIEKYVRYGAPLMTIPIFTWIIHSSDIYIIGFFYGATQVGFYSAIYILSKVIYIFMGPLTFILYPAVFKAWDKKNFDEVKTYLSYSMKYFLMLAIPSSFGIYILAEPILRLMTTTEFVSKSFLFPFILFGLVVYKTMDVPLVVLNALKKVNLIAKLFLSSAILNLILNVILIPRQGILGAAIATLFTYIFMSLVVFYESRKVIRFNLNILFILKSIFASFVMSGVLSYLPVSSTMSLISNVVLGAAIYFGVLLLMQGLSKNEITFLWKLQKN
jgi:O-antigen/teichoic acid export membrane protein